MNSSRLAENIYVDVSIRVDIEELLNKRGAWYVATIRQSFGWVVEATAVRYRDLNFLLLPETNELMPAVAFSYEGVLDDDQAREQVLGFLSALSWINHGTLQIVYLTSGNIPIRTRKGEHGQMTHQFFDVKYLPTCRTPTERLALSLYRDSLGIEHVAFRYLALYRIIQLVFSKNRSAIKNWVTATSETLTGLSAKNRVLELHEQGIDINSHLYQTNRGAIAHASEDELTVDPDNVDDERRIRADTPLLLELVERAMEERYGFLRMESIHSGHLNEMFGFHSLFGEKLSSDLRRGETIGRRKIQLKLTHIGVRVRGEPQQLNLGQLTPRVKSAYNGVVQLQLCNERNTLRLDVSLDFPNNRLLFDPLGAHDLLDDGTADAAADAAAMYRFLAAVMMNGSIEFWDADRNQCLAWLWEYIPKDIMPFETSKNLINKAEQFVVLVEKRRTSESET